MAEAPGYSMVYDVATDRQSMTDALTFLKNNLKL
jgi:hypothetical protein